MQNISYNLDNSDHIDKTKKNERQNSEVRDFCRHGVRREKFFIPGGKLIYWTTYSFQQKLLCLKAVGPIKPM